MNGAYYKKIQLGKSIPLNNPYAFSVSMPTIQDVIDYEEGTQESLNAITSAYPRILFHPYIEQVLEIAAEKLNLKEYKLFLLPDLISAKRVSSLSNTTPEYFDFGGYIIVGFNIGYKDVDIYYSFMKHCGYMIFAREAEDLLRKLGYNPPEFKENIITDNSENKIIDILSDGYNSKDILLSNCGMNAIYAGFKAVKSLGLQKDKKLFILYGWAYSDTIQIFKKCTDDYIILGDVSSTKELEILLSKRGVEVAGLYLETVSNPLIEIPNIPKVYELSRKFNFPVLIDNTFPTPWNVDVSPYCDLIFESLTKFASGQGDLMAGAVILPTNSKLNPIILDEIKTYISPLYKRVKDRLAYSIAGYKERVLKVNANTKIVFDYLNNNENVKEIFSIKNLSQIDNWNKISKSSDSFCGVISVVFNKEIHKVYNNITLPKGPSLGTEFPIVMSYTLLAHYNETKTEAGLQYLKEIGMSPDLLRISIGIDDPELIISAIELSLKN